MSNQLGAALRGQSALVTGGGRGLGRGIALQLARAGAAVAVVARTRAELDAVVDEIETQGGHGLAADADVSDRGAVEAAVGLAESRLGPLSILVNNAGLAGPFGPLGVVDPDAWWRAQEIHVRGALLFMSAVLPGMRERGRGRIVNIASRAGRWRPWRPDGTMTWPAPTWTWRAGRFRLDGAPATWPP